MTFNKILFVFSIVFASIQSCLCVPPVSFCPAPYQGASSVEDAWDKYIHGNFAKYSKIYLCDTNEHIATLSFHPQENYPPDRNESGSDHYSLPFKDMDKINSVFNFTDVPDNFFFGFHVSCVCKKKKFCEPSGFTLPGFGNITNSYLENMNPGRMYAVCADTLDVPESDNDSNKDEDLSVGAIVGISVGSFVFLCLLVYVIRHKIKTGSWPFMKKESVPDVKIEMKGLIF